MPRMRLAIRSGWKGSIWSSFSPMPANLMGLPVSALIDSAAPPRASPSSFVSMTPVISSASSKACAVATASWPIIASMTSRISAGLTAALMFCSSVMSASSMCRRPAVSRKTRSLPCFFACSMPALAISTGSPCPIWNTGISSWRPTVSSCWMAAGRYTSHATSSGRLPCLRMRPASLAPLVVLPAPCRPTSMTTLGDWELMFSFWFSLPMRAVSSSLTILMTICAGERLSSTSAPVARSVTLRTKSLTTLKFTSASSSASLTSRMASFTSASVSRPLPRRRLNASVSLSDRDSNAMVSILSDPEAAAAPARPGAGHRRRRCRAAS